MNYRRDRLVRIVNEKREGELKHYHRALDLMTMRQAIQTKYLGPTNKLGSRIKARASAGSITVPWSHELSPEQNHKRAAQIFCERLECNTEVKGGQLFDGSYVWVLVDV